MKLSIKNLSLAFILLVTSALFVGCGEKDGDNPVASDPTFSITVEPKTSVAHPGDEFGLDITIKGENGFSDEVTVTANANPTAMALNKVTGGTKYAVSYNVKVMANATTGKQVINVTVTGGGVTKQATAEVTIETDPNAVASLEASQTDTLWSPVGTSIVVNYTAKNASGNAIAWSASKTLSVTSTGVRSSSITITDVSDASGYKLKYDFVSLSSDSLTETPVSVSASLDGKSVTVKAVSVPDFTGLNWGKKGEANAAVTFVQNGKGIEITSGVGYPLALSGLKISKNRLLYFSVFFNATNETNPTKITGKSVGGGVWVYEKK